MNRHDERLDRAEAEIARLENITEIQQKQVERLMAERDALKAKLYAIEQVRGTH